MALQGPIDLSRILALGQLAGNALAIPNQVGQETQQQKIERTLLSANAGALGITPEQVNQLAPDPGMQFLNPASHPGTVGKLLTGVGDIGQILSAVLGSPTAPPRIPLSELTALASLRGVQSSHEAALAHQHTMEGLARERLETTKRAEADKTSDTAFRHGQAERRTAAIEKRVTDASAREELKTYDQFYRHFLGRDPLTHEYTDPATAAKLARAAMKERAKQEPAGTPAGGKKGSKAGDIPVPPLESLPPQLQDTVREIKQAVVAGRIGEDEAHEMIADIYRRAVAPTTVQAPPGMTVSRAPSYSGRAVSVGP